MASDKEERIKELKVAIRHARQMGERDYADELQEELERLQNG